jgi:hypothetical protein
MIYLPLKKTHVPTLLHWGLRVLHVNIGRHSEATAVFVQISGTAAASKPQT